jgi:hypothetical protein
VQHTPDEQGWEDLLTGAVRVLRAAEEEPLQQNPAVAGVDTGFARQEFISGGQQVRGVVAATPYTHACLYLSLKGDWRVEVWEESLDPWVGCWVTAV